MHTTGEPYIILEGGLIQNDPALPSFDLDALEDEDTSGLLDLYERLLELPAQIVAQPGAGLRHALSRTEAAVRALTGVDAEQMALARTDEGLRQEIISTMHHGAYDTVRQIPVLGEISAQYLAERVLGLIGIADAAGRAIALTDADPDPGDRQHLQINSGQLAYAVEQYRQSTGYEIDPDALESHIPWV